MKYFALPLLIITNIATFYEQMRQFLFHCLLNSEELQRLKRQRENNAEKKELKITQNHLNYYFFLALCQIHSVRAPVGMATTAPVAS